MAGFSYIDEINWKYVNSGTADLLSSSGTTLTDLPETQSRTGSAVYQTTRTKCFGIPSTKEIWLKFDVFTTLSTRWRAYNGGSNGASGVTAQTDGGLAYFANDTNLSPNGNNIAGVVKNQLQSVVLHMVSDSSAGIVEAWVDGEFIYKATGNVNNGNDFADIYLQSDGSGTFFSNVLISNIQSPPIARQVNIKPAIFATALIDLPTAEIDIKPELFAVVATKPPTAEIDFLPEIYVTIKDDAPTAEIDIQPEIWAIIRPLAHLEDTTADTLLRAGLTQTARGDTLRKITFTPAIESATADTKLVIGQTQIVSADTSRKIQRTEIATADTCRALREFATADTLRIICSHEEITADTVIRRPHELRYVVETPARRLLKAAPAPSIVNSFKDYGVASFEVTLNERTLSDNFTVEVAREMAINEAVRGQLLDYQFNFLVEETSQQGLIQTVKGMYDIDKLLYSHIDSSGTISYRNGDTQEITAAITAGYFIYNKDETTTVVCAKATDIIIRTADYLGLTPNIRIQNFTPYNLSGTTNITYSDLISTLFSWTSRLPQRQINVFIRGGTLHCIQRGLENSAVDISDWKHSRPKVDKKLLRTMYNNPFGNSKIKDKDKDDDPNQPSGEWQEEEIVRPFSGTISFEDDGSYTSLVYKKGLLRSETSRTSNNKISTYSRTTYTYVEVFPEGTTDLAIFLHNLVGDFYLGSKYTESTTIQYNGVHLIVIDGTEVGKGKAEAKVEDKTKIETYSYNEYVYKGTGAENLYLYKEYEGNYKAEYVWNQTVNTTTGRTQSAGWEFDYDETNDRQTFHIPVGNGWYATSVFLNGEPQGSTLSQGKPGNKVSPYTINEVQKTFTTVTYDPDDDDGDDSGHSSAEDEYEEWRRRLSPVADTSFPVRELDLIRVLTQALYWLNRKTQETVHVDITDEIINGVPTINHIVDFTERVILDGNEYFLVSNQISFTPRSLIQKLQLVRWY